ncbi:MAG: SufE family protein [Hahellaceae bacterium]|nr:SufE family protein [Hahellaceae bacterium]MCP5211041.1 SufE family protein [Hahellaceae bacterium]
MTSTDLFLNNPLGVEVQIDEVLDAFSFLDDWEERYAYIIDLGRKLPAFPEPEKTAENLVHGCQSQVWLIHHIDTDTGKIFLLIESDAMIVRGLAALILCMLNAKTPEQLLQVDIDGIFAKLDLFRHISPTRGNGLRSMLQKITLIASNAKS